MNRKSKKYSQKTVGILLESLCVVVSVYVGGAYACVGYSCVLMCVCMGLNTLHIILHLVRHKPTKWFSDNQHC